MFFPFRSYRRRTNCKLATWLSLMLAIVGASTALADPAPVVVSIDPAAAFQTITLHRRGLPRCRGYACHARW